MSTATLASCRRAAYAAKRRPPVQKSAVRSPKSLSEYGQSSPTSVTTVNLRSDHPIWVYEPTSETPPQLAESQGGSLHWLAECNSVRRGRPGWAEPEIWFRIVHVAPEGHDGATVAAYREQTVEIALGPNGAFDNGNIGTLTRRVPADRVVCAVPPLRGLPKPPRGPKTPRVVELLHKAMEWQALLESGEASNQAAIARREGITRARVTQVMGMLRFAPEIQRHILSLPNMVRRPAITERALRPIAQLDAEVQAGAFKSLTATSRSDPRSEMSFPSRHRT